MGSEREYDAMFRSLGSSLDETKRRMGLPTQGDIDDEMRNQFRRLGYKVRGNSNIADGGKEDATR